MKQLAASPNAKIIALPADIMKSVQGLLGGK